MPYELWLSVRYLLARRRERFVSIIAVLSIFGVAIGVAALLLVMSVMSGFDHDLKEKLVGINAHLTVESVSELREPEPVMRVAAATEHVVGVAPYMMGQAILRLPDRAFGVLVRGIDPERERQVSKLADYLVQGKFPSSEREMIIGTELAASMHASVGKPLEVISPADGESYELTVSGIFKSGMYEFDATMIGVTIPLAQHLFGLDGMVSGIAIRLDSLESAPKVRAQLQKELGLSYMVKTWTEQNSTLFAALRLEKITMSVILTLIVLVAAVNIASTLIMMVTEKTRDIGILKAIGASSGAIWRIFTWQGLLIGFVSTGLGLGFAAGTIWLQNCYEIVRLPNSIYYLDHLPVRIEAMDWTLTVVAALVISLLATLYPASQASRLSPVESLRYE